MKLSHISLALLMGLGTLTSCNDKLELVNPNQQTTGTFGFNANDLEESVVAAYNHIRMEGSYARVGYTIDVCRGDEAWNSSQVWYLPFDDLNAAVTSDITWWPWREWYYTINVCNFAISRCGTNNATLSQDMKRIKGQVLFLRALAYYNLAGYYQNPPLITDYASYSTLDGLYGKNNTYDEVLDQVEKDFQEAMTLLPARTEGGEWAKGRATSGAAAGYYARTLMQRHKYSEALAVLKDIIGKKYGSYKLMANYGDNFREGPQYENNDESLFEVQFLDKDAQGTDDEWTPVNTSPNATQGSAIESNFAPGRYGGWADISASPWLYQLFKQERTTAGKLDPRLYWTIGTYEADWEGFEYGNMGYRQAMTATDTVVTNNSNGGLPIAKFTNLRTGLYDKVVTGLHDGINLRMMRYADVLLRAAECENEINGPTQQAIDWINEVRRRAGLADLKLADFPTADKLFEQIANVERPKEFGCEFGRGFDLIRWGFFYSADRLQQLKEHGTFRRSLRQAKEPVSYADIAKDSELKCSYDTYVQGHEFLPIVQTLTNKNPNLKGNSANESTDNAAYFQQNGWTVRPVVSLGK
ncbi:RagB/SusD family nutrient uptake outer membrane protein [Hallella seregens]|uniref:RagB/SusD family nutrient uptake outer membrane protein n=1 Tax=Hallella seregens ATCC 51272 TaxID=1336250 RepID=A0ABV5ZLF5_9BACT|nr:RagB/SusD family nutrient uptake outer membrane protein [Hallella seregens]